MSSSSSSSFGSSRSIILAVVVVIVGYGISQISTLLFSNVDLPSSNFGSGQMFDSIAGRYDMINRVLALGLDISWRKEQARTLHKYILSQQQQNQKQQQDTTTAPKILDVSTGTADVAIITAKEIPSATIIGVDPSQQMLNVGIDKIKKAKLDDRLTLYKADARTLTSESNSFLEMESFDGITQTFGIRNVVPGREQALCEYYQLLKKDGMLCILEFSNPSPPDSYIHPYEILKGIARLFIKYVVPTLGGLLSGHPKEYLHLQNSIKDFPTPNEFKNLLQNLNCPTGTTTTSTSDDDDDDDKSLTGNFYVREIQNMAFDSVQLYVAIKK